MFNPLILQRNESVKYLTLSCRLFFLTDLINFNSLITFLMVNNIFICIYRNIMFLSCLFKFKISIWFHIICVYVIWQIILPSYIKNYLYYIILSDPHFFFLRYFWLFFFTYNFFFTIKSVYNPNLIHTFFFYLFQFDFFQYLFFFMSCFIIFIHTVLKF